EVRIYDAKDVEVHHQTTPFTVALDRGRGFFAAEYYTFKATGSDGRPIVVTRKAGFAGWYFGNLLFGGLIGIVIVDPLTGAMWEFDGDVKMDPTAAVASGSGTPAGKPATSPPFRTTDGFAARPVLESSARTP